MEHVDHRDPLGIQGVIIVCALIAGSWILLKMLWTLCWHFFPMN